MTPKILLIGSVGAGKTSLKQSLLREPLVYRKTQVLEFSSLFVDCPGEYVEMPQYYHVLVDAGHRVSEIWAIQDATRTRAYFPPNFAKAFNKPIIGVVTKIDHERADAVKAAEYLRLAGFTGQPYLVSALTGEGVGALAERLTFPADG